MKREPVAQAINYIISALDIIAGMALKAETYDEVAAEEIGLGRVISRTELILSFLDTHKPAKIKTLAVPRPHRRTGEA